MDQREAAAGSGTTRRSRLFIAAKKRRGSIKMRLCLSANVNHGVGDGGGGGRGWGAGGSVGRALCVRVIQ